MDRQEQNHFVKDATSHPGLPSQPSREVVLDILGIARIPIALQPGECVAELRHRLCFAPGLRVLHDGQLMKDSALLPAGSSVMLAPSLLGGGSGGSTNDEDNDSNTVSGAASAPEFGTSPIGSALNPDFLLGTSATSSVRSNGSRSSGGGQRCSLGGCEDRPAKIVGDCRYCKGHFCSKHRLPEAHLCDQMDHCRQQSLAKNTDKLMRGKCVADKM